ncbi:MAG TPA: hypothetical protein VHS06_07045, partial [Chloroflexota bacterium]|nr:hypothetical protein [Chloroflexota bacterium]
VEVVNANIGGNVDRQVEQRNENSEVSRIRFIMHMPTKTRAKIQQENNALFAPQRGISIDDPYI